MITHNNFLVYNYVILFKSSDNLKFASLNWSQLQNTWWSIGIKMKLIINVYIRNPFFWNALSLAPENVYGNDSKCSQVPHFSLILHVLVSTAMR